MFFKSIICALLLGTSAFAAPPTADALHKEVVNAISAETHAQKLYTQWTTQKMDMASDIRDMKAMDAWLHFQNIKYEKYIAQQKKVIAELHRRKEEAKHIRMELEPFLEKIVAQLDTFVSNDLPFLTEERTKRLEFLHAALDDYHLELSEKLRRVFEAIHIETEYGRNVSTSPAELSINGETKQVSIFRLGRTALYYQTLDGSTSGVWDTRTQSWKPLDAEFGRTLKLAKDMADKKRAVELLNLPIGD